MYVALAAALLGAIIGFIGTFSIQRGQWRREELATERLRLGAVRSPKIDLAAVAMAIESAQVSRAFAVGTRFPTSNWHAHGYLVLGLLKPAGVEALTEAFGRFDLLNGIVEARTEDIDLDSAQARDVDLVTLNTKITDAIDVLLRFEGELDAQRRKLQHPLRWRAERLARLSRGP